MAKFQGVEMMILVKVFIEVGCINVGKLVCCNLKKNFFKLYFISQGIHEMSVYQGIQVVSIIPVYARSLKLHSLELSC